MDKPSVAAERIWIGHEIIKLRFWVQVISGLALAGFGLLLLFIDILTWMDPAGAQLSDDGDPFGKPPSQLQIMIYLGVALVVLTWGIWLTRNAFKHPLTQSREP